jgi:hypothetical protein
MLAGNWPDDSFRDKLYNSGILVLTTTNTNKTLPQAVLRQAVAAAQLYLLIQLVTWKICQFT